MPSGKVYKYGDNVDTDVIIPARYLNAPSPDELAKHCMEDIDATFAQKVQPGDIIVGARTSAAVPPANMRRLPSRVRRLLRHCAELRAHFLPQRHQHRLPDSGMPQSGGGDCKRRPSIG